MHGGGAVVVVVAVDAVSRKMAIELLLQMAANMEHRQFIFITPQDLSTVQVSDKVGRQMGYPSNCMRGREGPHGCVSTVGGGRAGAHPQDACAQSQPGRAAADHTQLASQTARQPTYTDRQTMDADRQTAWMEEGGGVGRGGC